MANPKTQSQQNPKSGPGQKILSASEMKERVRKIAQELYEKRGRRPGHELEDWLEAERQVKQETGSNVRIFPETPCIPAAGMWNTPLPENEKM